MEYMEYLHRHVARAPSGGVGGRSGSARSEERGDKGRCFLLSFVDVGSTLGLDTGAPELELSSKRLPVWNRI